MSNQFRTVTPAMTVARSSGNVAFVLTALLVLVGSFVIAFLLFTMPTVKTVVIEGQPVTFSIPAGQEEAAREESCRWFTEMMTELGDTTEGGTCAKYLD